MLKKIIKIGGIFVAGILVGATLMNLLHMFVRPVYREIIQTDLQIEQEFLAGRAIRNNDKLQAVLHRWNVVYASSIEGFRVFRKDKYNNDIDSSFFLPFHLLPLTITTSSQEKNLGKGRKILEGINRGKLAIALESIGQKKEADTQWQIAKTMIAGKSIAEIRQMVLWHLEQEKSTIYLQAEEVLLR